MAFLVTGSIEDTNPCSLSVSESANFRTILDSSVTDIVGDISIVESSATASLSSNVLCNLRSDNVASVMSSPELSVWTTSLFSSVTTTLCHRIRRSSPDFVTTALTTASSNGSSFRRTLENTVWISPLFLSGMNFSNQSSPTISSSSYPRISHPRLFTRATFPSGSIQSIMTRAISR